MTITIIIIVGIIILIFLVMFLKNFMQDNVELDNISLENRYHILLAEINAGILDSKGELTVFKDDKRHLVLMDPNRQNIKIDIHYSTGSIMLHLGFLFYHEEMTYHKTFYNMRNANNFVQREVAREFIMVARDKMEKQMHQVSSLKNNPVNTNSSVINPESINHDDDPERMFNDAIFGDLTHSQKLSAVNLIYVIMDADKHCKEDINNNIIFSSFVRTADIQIDDALKQLDAFGEGRIISDLKSISDFVISFLIYTAFCTIPVNGVPSSARASKFDEMFMKLGYNEDDVNSRLEKIALFAQMFNGK